MNGNKCKSQRRHRQKSSSNKRGEQTSSYIYTNEPVEVRARACDHVRGNLCNIPRINEAKTERCQHATGWELTTTRISTSYPWTQALR